MLKKMSSDHQFESPLDNMHARHQTRARSIDEMDAEDEENNIFHDQQQQDEEEQEYEDEGGYSPHGYDQQHQAGEGEEEEYDDSPHGYGELEEQEQYSPHGGDEQSYYDEDGEYSPRGEEEYDDQLEEDGASRSYYEENDEEYYEEEDDDEEEVAEFTEQDVQEQDYHAESPHGGEKVDARKEKKKSRFSFKKIPKSPLARLRGKSQEKRESSDAEEEKAEKPATRQRSWSGGAAGLMAKLPPIPSFRSRKRSSSESMDQGEQDSQQEERGRANSVDGGPFEDGADTPKKKGSFFSRIPSSPLNKVFKSGSDTPKSTGSSGSGRIKRFWSTSSTEKKEQKEGPAKTAVQKVKSFSGSWFSPLLMRKKDKPEAAATKDMEESKFSHDRIHSPAGEETVAASTSASRDQEELDEEDESYVSGSSRGGDDDEYSDDEAYEETVRVCLTAYYIENQPNKLSDIPTILEKYRGNEEDMFDKLERKYGVPIPSYEEAIQIVELHELEEKAHDQDKENSSLQTNQLPYGQVKRLGLKFSPHLSIGLEYHDCDKFILMDLCRDFIVENSSTVVARSVLATHGRYFDGVNVSTLISNIDRIKANVQLSKPDSPRHSPPPVPHREEEQPVENAVPSPEKENDDDDVGVRSSIEKLEQKLTEQEDKEARESADWMWEGRENSDNDNDEEEHQEEAMVSFDDESGNSFDEDEDEDEDQFDFDKASYRDRQPQETKQEWKKRLRLVDEAILELVESERLYFNDLDTINDLVIVPLMQQMRKRAIRFTSKNHEALESLFTLWGKLVRCHEKLNEKLWNSCMDESNETISLKVCWNEREQPLHTCLKQLRAILPDISPVYDDYCLLYGDGLACYAHELQINKPLQKFLQTQCEGALRGSSLEVYLIKPVQRICKYPLLLTSVQDYMKVVDLGAKSLVQRARTIVEDVKRDYSNLVDQIDRHKLQAEKLSQMADIHNRLRFGEDESSISLMEPHRILFWSGTLNVNSSSTSGECAPRFVLLYNDVVLITISRKSWSSALGKVYDVANVIPLKNASVDPIVDPNETKSLVQTRYGLELSTAQGTWVLGMDMEAVYKQWLNAVHEAITFSSSILNQQRGSHVLDALMKLTSEQKSSSFVQRLTKAPSSLMNRTFGSIHKSSAVVIQKTYRGLLGRRRVVELRHQMHLEVRAALIIQRYFKRMKKRRYWAKQDRLERERLKRVQNRTMMASDEDEDDDFDLNSFDDEQPTYLEDEQEGGDYHDDEVVEDEAEYDDDDDDDDESYSDFDRDMILDENV